MLLVFQNVCPLENDNSTLVVVIGGETTRENRENEHSTSVEIIGPAGHEKSAKIVICQ
jgi:hypothetical protein